MPLQIPVTQTGLEASIEAAAKKAGRNLKIDLGTNTKSINALSQPLGRITGQADEFTKSMEAANARVFAFGASVGIIHSVSSAFGTLIKNTIEVEKSLVEINSVLNESGDSLQKFGNKLFDVAKSTGQTFDVVAKGALELARQGLDTEETLKRINDALILSRLSGLDAQQSVEGLTAAFNSFKETGITTSQILNKLVVVSQQYSVSERDLIEGLKRSASVADQAGVSFDELVGIITTVQERTARGGAVIGNAFKTIFARIQDTGALQDLANLGIQVTDLEGKVLPATRILQNLGAEFNNLSQLEQADIAKKLGGVYQLSNLLAAVKDLSSEQSKYNDIVQLSAGATNEAYQKNAALNETLASLINKVSVSAQQLGATLGAIGITDNLKSLLSFFNNVLEGIQKILGEESALGTFVQGLAKGIGNVLAGPGLMLFGAIIAKLSKDLISFGFESLKSFFKIGQAAKDIERLQGSIASTLLKNKDIQTQILSLEGNRVAQAKFFTAALNEQYLTMQKMQGIAASIAPAVYGGTRGTRGGASKNAAGGYMPAVSQESRDISRGVGGAKAGDKPVVIPNFAFGGGKRGTMVAHTGEFIVPNFAAGGSAIFNRDMVRSMGLPAGAKKIGAAGGFVPNFNALQQFRALWGNDIDTSSPTFKRDWSQYKQINNIDPSLKANINTSQEIVQGFKNWRDTGGRSLARRQARESAVKINEKGQSKYALLYPGSEPKTGFVSTAGGQQVKVGSIVTQPSDFLYTELRKSFINTAKQYVKNIGIQPDIINDEKFLNVANQSFNEGVLQGAVGNIFEMALQASTGSPPTSSIANFDIAGKTKVNTFANSFAKGTKNSYIRDVLRNIEALDFKNAFHADNINTFDTKIKNHTAQAQIASKLNEKNLVKNVASGYIPNFANPLKEAIGREMSAGIPASQIYVDQNSSLKNSMNPMGLMVANRRDEPAGGIQGINRARKEGANPMTYGAASGFVPNYARDPVTGRFVKASDVSTTSGGVDLEQPKRDLLGVIFAVQTGLSLLTGATADATSAFGKYTNIVSSGIGTASSILFAFQGLGSALPKFAGFLGPAGIAVSAATAAFQIGKGIFLELSGANKRAADAGKTLATAAEKAALRLDELGGSGKQDVERTVEDIIEKLNININEAELPELKKAISAGLLGTSRTDVENVLKTNLKKQNVSVQTGTTTFGTATFGTESSLGGKITNAVNKLADLSVTGQGAVLTKDFLPLATKAQSPEELRTLINTELGKNLKDFTLSEGLIKEIFDPEALLKAENQLKQLKASSDPNKLNLLTKEGKSPYDWMDQPTSQLIPEGASELTRFLEESNISYTTALELINKINEARQQQGAAEAEALAAAKKGISEQVQETLKLLKVQQLIDKRKAGEEVVSKTYELANQERMLAISSDLSMSETQRAKALVLLENAYTNVNKEIEAGSKISDALDTAMADISEKSSKALSAFNAGQIKDAMTDAKKVIIDFGSEAKNSELISAAIAENGTGATKAYEALANVVRGKLGQAYRNNNTYVDLITDNLIKYKNEETKITSEVQREIYFRGKLAELTLKQKQIEEDRKNIVEGVNYNLEGRASALSYQASQISNASSRNEASRKLETAIYERTASTTNIEDYQRGLDEINEKYFNLEQDALLQKAELEAKANLIRNNKVDENSVKIGDNTTAINELKTLLDNDFKRLLSELPNQIKTKIQEIIPALSGMPTAGTPGQTGYAAGNINNSGLSQGLIDYVKKKENSKEQDTYKAFWDSGQWSVGFGTKSYKGEQITKSEAYDRLIQELKKHAQIIEDATKKYGVELNQNQKDALISFDYNTGRGTNLLSRFKKEFDSDFGLLTDTMLKYNKEKKDGPVIPGLAKRREEEVAMFNAPVATTQANNISQLSQSIDNLRFDLAGRDRKDMPNESLLNDIRQMVKQVYGEKAVATIYSGKGYTEGGSRRHEGGKAADIYVEIDGKRVSGEELAKLGATWVTQGKGSAGYGMQGGSAIHLDSFTKDQLRGNEGLSWGYGGGTGSVLKNLINKMGGAPGLAVNQTTKQLTAQQFGLSDDMFAKAKEISAKNENEIAAAAEEAAKSYNKSAEETQKIKENLKQVAFELKAASSEKSTNKFVNDQNKKIDALNRLKKSFGEGWNDALEEMNEQISTFEERLGKTIPTSFADNLAQGIQDAVNGAKSLEDALLNAALSFTQEISNMAIKNLAQQFTTSIFPGFSQGGEVKGYASGGMINGGSGTKDDVPAMLMSGEYVINKKSVQKYGPEFLHAINNGNLGGYAKGGKVKDLPVQSGVGGFYTPGTYGKGGIQGRQNLLDFATQAATSGQYDVITGGDNYASINLEGESMRLTNFGRSRGPQAEAIRSAKEEAFGLYEQDIRAEQERKRQEEELNKQRKAMIKQMAIQIGMAVAGSAAGAGASGFKAAFKAAKAGGATGFSAFGSGIKGIFTGASASGGINVGGLNNWFTGVGKGLTGNFGQAGNYFKLSQMGSLDQLGKAYSMGIGLDGKNSPFTNFLDKSGYTPRAFSVDPKQSNGIMNMFGLFGNRRATGGTIPSTTGIDTVPAMLSGGEFVMNRAASQNIGAGNLQALNAGASSLPTEEKTEELNDRLVAKLDELIATMTESANAGSITINVDSNGKSTQESSGETSESKEKLARQIKDTVMKVIEQEKRLGGKLRRGL